MQRVVVVGLGPIGLACARAVRRQPGMELTGLVDLDPSRQGLTLTELTGGDEEGGPKVVATLGGAFENGVDLGIVSTTSNFGDVAETLHAFVDQGASVVSSCEEMAWPWYRWASLAEELDGAAREKGSVLLGTGINPGFVMDSLAVVLATAVRRARKIRCVRRVDAGLRRRPLQKKVGATISIDEFNELKAAGKIGHRGIAESAALIAHGMGRHVEPDSVVETLEPVVAEHSLPSACGLIEAGRVAGMRNQATWEDGKLRIELDLTMAVGVSDPVDKIRVEGPVGFTMKIPGSIPGDSATVAMLVNCGRAVTGLSPGLRTMLDVPPAGCRLRGDGEDEQVI